MTPSLSARKRQPPARGKNGKGKFLTSFVVLLFLFAYLSPSVKATEYVLAMLPLFGTEEISNRISPLAKHLSKATGFNIVPAFSTDFSQYAQQLSSGVIHIGYENPYIYTQNSSAHEVIAMASTGDQGDRFRGIIITRSDSLLKSLEDLRGKKIAIVSRSSTGGFLSQNLTLKQNGFNVLTDCFIEEAPENKQENVILSVYTGDVDAGFIRESALPQVKEFVPEDAIHVLARTAWLPNWALSLSRKIPEKDKTKIAEAIWHLQPGDPALMALKVHGFRPARDNEYDPVRAGTITDKP